MIRSMALKNFKSLVNFNINFKKFTCLIGLNGAGKSTVLQGLDFLGNLMVGDLKQWLVDRKWKASDMSSRLGQKKGRRNTIDFSLVVDVNDKSLRWSGVFNCSEYFLRCTSETVETVETNDSESQVLAKVVDGSYKLGEGQFRKIDFEYQGSIFSILKDAILNNFENIKYLRDEVRSIQSLDLLSPLQMRERARKKAQVGLGGEGLSAFIFDLSQKERNVLIDHLRHVYPSFSSIDVKSLRSGWKDLIFSEQYDEVINSGARHINDGLLRLTAIFSHLVKEKHFLLFDEIENGINPEVVKYLMSQLINARQQVLVTTHSPMILNYLDDNTARESVVLLFRNTLGHTGAVPFFDLPETSKKLGILGPGEVFVDSFLDNLVASYLESTESGE